jgi:hypothetical protein
MDRVLIGHISQALGGDDPVAVRDFFNYIATAWLVLQLTGSGLALGSVLVVQALPRAVLMVVGGALADRISSRLTMLGSM